MTATPGQNDFGVSPERRRAQPGRQKKTAPSKAKGSPGVPLLLWPRSQSQPERCNCVVLTPSVASEPRLPSGCLRRLATNFPRHRDCHSRHPVTLLPPSPLPPPAGATRAANDGLATGASRATHAAAAVPAEPPALPMKVPLVATLPPVPRWCQPVATLPPVPPTVPPEPSRPLVPQLCHQCHLRHPRPPAPPGAPAEPPVPLLPPAPSPAGVVGAANRRDVRRRAAANRYPFPSHTAQVPQRRSVFGAASHAPAP